MGNKRGKKTKGGRFSGQRMTLKREAEDANSDSGVNPENNGAHVACRERREKPEGEKTTAGVLRCSGSAV